MDPTRRKLDTSTARRLAVEADTDPRTIQKMLRGDPARTIAAKRARRVLVSHGILKEEA